MKIDKIENTEEYKQIEKELKLKELYGIEKELNNKIELELELKGYKNKQALGFCHIYWELKKEILKTDYNIDWKSPQDLNPEIIFD